MSGGEGSERLTEQAVVVVIIPQRQRRVDAVFEAQPGVAAHKHGMDHSLVGNEKSPKNDLSGQGVTSNRLNAQSNGRVGGRGGGLAECRRTVVRGGAYSRCRGSVSDEYMIPERFLNKRLGGTTVGKRDARVGNCYTGDEVKQDAPLVEFWEPSGSRRIDYPHLTKPVPPYKGPSSQGGKNEGRGRGSPSRTERVGC